MSSRLQSGNLRNSPDMQEELLCQGKGVTQLEIIRCKEHVQSNLSQFKRSFNDFASFEPVASYMCYRFGAGIDVGGITAKVKPLFEMESSALEKRTLRSKPDQHPINLRSMQCSGNCLWRRSIPISKDVPWTWQLFLDQLVCASLVSHTWKSWSPSTDQQWLRAALQPVYTLQPLVTTVELAFSQCQVSKKLENNFLLSNSKIHLFCIWYIDFLFSFYWQYCLYQTDWRVCMCLWKEGFVIWSLDWGCVTLREIDFLLKICWSIPCLHPSWKVHTWSLSGGCVTARKNAWKVTAGWKRRIWFAMLTLDW